LYIILNVNCIGFEYTLKGLDRICFGDSLGNNIITIIKKNLWNKYKNLKFFLKI
jgi:Fe-S cluster biosynthesis and repair protein YggX